MCLIEHSKVLMVEITFVGDLLEDNCCSFNESDVNVSRQWSKLSSCHNDTVGNVAILLL
jgi:hypothetical protein